MEDDIQSYSPTAVMFHGTPGIKYTYPGHFARDTGLPTKEFMKCRLDNFFMSFILFYVNLSICENK